MKVKKEKGFVPISILLELQEEMNALFAIGNYAPLSEIDPAYKELFALLDAYHTKEAADIHSKICSFLR